MPKRPGQTTQHQPLVPYGVGRLRGCLQVFGLFAALAGAPAIAADFSDPTWPCVQRKVETLSLGLMWPYAIDMEAARAVEGASSDVEALADLLALRRVEIEDLRADVEAFAAKHGGDANLLGLVFDTVFNRLSKRRTRIINGIGDFSLGQIALAKEIDADRLAFDAALDAEKPDYDQIDKLEERIDWSQLIYTDRQKSITYLCETPQLLEKRIYAIGQLLAQNVE